MLARVVLRSARNRAAADAGDVGRILDGDRLGVLVLLVVLLGVDLLVLLQVLGTLEGFLAYFADVGLQGCMYCAKSARDDE